MKVDYQQYLDNRNADLDKLSTILPELIGNLGEVKAVLGMVESAPTLKLFEGFRLNLCNLLGREVHPAECDVYVKLITNMSVASAMKELTEDIIKNINLEDLLDTEKMIEKLVDKTCKNLGAIIHGFDRDDIKKFFGDAIHAMLSRFGGMQGPNLGDMFGGE